MSNKFLSKISTNISNIFSGLTRKRGSGKKQYTLKKRLTPEVHKVKCIKNTTTNRCVTSYRANTTSKHCKYNHPTKRCSQIKDELPHVMFVGYKIQEPALKYLKKVVSKNSYAKMKDIAREKDLSILVPLENAGNATDANIYLKTEILDLSRYYSIDNLKHDVIVTKGIKHVINDDPELKEILK